MALTKNGANPERSNLSGNNAFSDAARERHPHVSEWLEKWRQFKESRSSPLHAIANFPEAIEVRDGDAVNVRSIVGKLMYSKRKDEIHSNHRVYDVIKSIAAHVGIDLRDVEIRLVAGTGTPLNPQDALRSLLQEEGNVELSATFVPIVLDSLKPPPPRITE
jgi:hypothetical protein